uniref:Manganese(II)-oxidizing enzyme n=1 Tax=Sarocladium strictum TaxID=5046 RepID=A0A7U3V701_SARSR|nr:manganese(II)-oxidizing enzyme [Sarocladium strictum]
MKSTLLLLTLSLLTRLVSAQEWTLANPDEELAALEAVVEDEAGAVVKALKKDESPEYPLIYGKPLPIPPVKEPLKVIKNPVTGNDIWYYEIELKAFTKSIYPNLRPATLVGYDGMSPGPTFMLPKGTESIVRFVNNAKHENSVHLHGSYSRAPFDGWAEDVIQPGEYKDYYYPNQQSARLQWYHDHAMHLTAENAYMGQAGAYILTDSAEDVLELPSGYGKYDIPLILTAKQYNADGSLFSTVGEDQSLWGDVIEVNGQPWPFLNVEPRKYRLRFLNAAISRSFALYFVKATAVNARLPFQVIASDTGLLTEPVQVSSLYVSMAERYEIVFDFSNYAGQTLELRNLDKVGGIGTDDDYENTNKVMRFIVSPNTVEDNSKVPEKLRDIALPQTTSNKIDHHFRFHRTNSEWRINGVGFADVENRVLAKVPRGTVEIWELENSSDGWTHPIHVHLVDFLVLDREGGRGVMPYEKAGLKDVVWLGKGETVRVAAVYAPWDGLYMFHCHNLIHEDQDMMAAFNVTSLSDFGYGGTDFLDPMQEEWQAKPCDLADFKARTGPFSDDKIVARVEAMARANPYGDIQEVEAALEEYWAKKKLSARDHEPVGPIPRYRRFVV